MKNIKRTYSKSSKKDGGHTYTKTSSRSNGKRSRSATVNGSVSFPGGRAKTTKTKKVVKSTPKKTVTKNINYTKGIKTKTVKRK